MSDNVTRIHPAPSIPSPLMSNPWAAISDADLDVEILRTEVRIDAAEHTLASLHRERQRRDDAQDHEIQRSE